MPATLPPKLSARLDYLAARVRKVRLMRAAGRAALLLPLAALVGIVADAYLGLPAGVRIGLFVVWVVLALRELRNLVRAWTAPVDLEAVASAVEEEFPRLAERLTTAVELADHADESNGAPALIDEVINDADSRARKLDLAAAFPTGGVVATCLTALLLLAALLVPLFTAPRGGELARRFFLPWYAPSKTANYKVVVTSGDPAVKRGDPVNLTAYVEATRPDAELPTAATLVVTMKGKEERLAMTAEDGNVWHGRRPAAEADFDYRVEAGGAVSDTHHVFVVEPVTLAAAHVAVTPPAYAAAGREPELPAEGLAELSALQHSTITFDLRFVPKPASAVLEFAPAPDPEAKPMKDRYPLTLAADGSARVTVPARVSGTFTLSAEGDRGVRSEFPAQPLQVHKDEPPKLPRVTGIGDKPRQVRPTERIVVEASATDDIAVVKFVLEWRIDGGPVQTIPLAANNLPAPQADGRAVLPLAGKVTAGQRVSCRLTVTDNRDVPEHNLKPQTVCYPERDQWAEFTVDPGASPLAEQEILEKKKDVETRLNQIRKELSDELGKTDALKNGPKNPGKLVPYYEGKVKDLKDQLRDTQKEMEAAAEDLSRTPDLNRLSETLRDLANREVPDADAALTKAKGETQAAQRTAEFEKASDALKRAIDKIDGLQKDNEKVAQDRLDRRKLEDLADEQKDLADKARTADPKQAADLAKKQKDLEDQLNKLQQQSDAIKKAADAARAEDINKLAAELKRAAEEMRDLNKAIKQSEKDSAQERLAELKKRQDELAKKAKDLAEKTDAASRIAQTQPLNPEDADKPKQALDKGDLDEAAKEQEKLRQELERLARDLEQAAANSKDPREAARQLARLQDELRNRLAQETKNKPLDDLPAERRAAMEKQQEAIERAVSKLKTPDGDRPAEAAKQRAQGDTQQAKDLLKKGVANGADRKMQEAKDSLEKLADRLPTKEQRLQRARDEIAKLKQQQEAIRQQADAAVEAARRHDPDAPATQRDLAKRLADSAKKQAALAEQLEKMDLPGQEARQEKAADALQRAAGDLTAGRPQDTQASQQAAKRELDRLDQALNGQMPADDKVAELAKKQRLLAQDAARNADLPDRGLQQDVQRRQAEVAREVEKLQTPEAASAQADAADAARKAAADGQKPDELAKKAKDAADKLDKLNEQVNGKEPAADAAKRLAERQKANADEQAKRPDNAGTGEARKKAWQELEELKNLRTGRDAQKAKQQAQDALSRAANHMDPQANGKAQKEATDALKDLADKLSKDQTAKGDARDEDSADAAERLAKKQRELADKTRKDADAANREIGDARDKAAKEAADKSAREQRDLANQAGELPGRDSPKDLQQAQESMGKAQDELARGNFDGAVRKQQEAADALDRLSQKSRDGQRERAGGDNPGAPTREQIDTARRLAEEQRKLQDEAMKAAEDLAKENGSRKDNAVDDLAKQQQEIAREAGDLAKKVVNRQGEKADQAKDAKQAADAAQQAAGQVKNGDLTRAKESGKQAADAMERLSQDKAGGDTGQKAKDLARRQADMNQKLDELSKDSGAGRAQQAARQQQLEQTARELGHRLEQLAQQSGDPSGKPAGQAKDAAHSANRSGDQMQQAREAGRKGQRDQAGQSRDGAAESMERAAQQAADAAKQLGGEPGDGSAQAGQALDQAKGQMGEAGKRLGQGQPGEAAGAMEKAAGALQDAAGQLGGRPGQGPAQGQPRPGQNPGGQNPGGNIGGPGGTVDLRNLSPELAQYTGKRWGELPGEIKTKVVQELRARYGEDYARNIKLYFEQLAERR
jgi:hypothetical protein